MIKIPQQLTLILSIIMLLNSTVYAQAHDHKMTMAEPKANSCKTHDIICAKTVTSAFAPNGDLWRVWALNQGLYYQISTDSGMNFSDVVKVDIAAEKISARNENRPKIAFDNLGGVYLSWAMPREKKYTADVRFSYSADYGKTFSTPITLNDDNLLAGHSFNEMLVKANGEVNLVWLDSRHAYLKRMKGEKSNGSSLYFAKANPRNNDWTFTNQALAQSTCVCCRITMDFNKKDHLAIMWRHIYGDNIRDFAMMTLDEKQTKPYRVTYDHWYINGCPHQGASLSIDTNNRYHMVWFNQGDKGKGIFYAYSDNQGKVLSKPLPIGKLSAQAAHPYLHHNGKYLDIVWTEFDGLTHQLWHQRSTDNGKTFTPAKVLAESKNGSDRPFIIASKGENYVSWHRPKQGHWVYKL